MSVGITAVCPRLVAFHRTAPSAALTPATDLSVSWMCWGTPPMVAARGLAYAALSVQPLDCQISAPVEALRAARVPRDPPGVRITFSPSTSGDSEKPQPDIIFPPRLSNRLLSQRTF